MLALCAARARRLGHWPLLARRSARVLVRIEFEVGEGHTRPVQLAFVPMLVLLPPGLVPLAVLAAHLPRRC